MAKKTSIKQTLRLLITPRFLIGVVVLCLFILINSFWLSYQHFVLSPLNFNQQSTLTINPGQTINALARKWQRQGVISHHLYLRTFIYLNPELSRIKTGEYAVTQDETITSLLTKLNQGVGIQYPFTIIEGMSSYEVLAKLKSTQFIQLDLNLEIDYSASEKARQDNQKMQTALAKKLGIIDSIKQLKAIDGIAKVDQNQLADTTAHIEGWFYPDTYYFTKNEKASRLLSRAVVKMQQVLLEEWHNRDMSLNLPYDSPYDVLIMASIIEKETGIHSERSKIAGVFTRRLHKKMPLGTDPTIIYGIGPSFNGDITFKDLRTKTPYNTRLNRGLTPTPIAMPSRASIHAALNPDDGESLYFVADGSGGHYFSKTLKEHNQAVQRYLKLKK
jgi:UPF0755 protein